MNVAIIGCGVRGSVVAALLAGAGIEELSLVDEAIVDTIDIGAHPLQFTPDVGAGKADALVAKLGLISPQTHAQPFPANLSAENAAAILSGADCAVDCVGDADVSDWIESAAKELGIPVVAPPADYDSSSVTRAVGAAVGALQADLVLARRDAGEDAATVDVIRVDAAAIG